MADRKAWYLGNTTVRNPKRLREGLLVLVDSPLHGNLVGLQQEQAFAELLHTRGIVDVLRLGESPGADASDVGRKWRAALVQLGFITPRPSILRDAGRSDSPFVATSNGRRLMQAHSLPEDQDCFLRALLAHQLPSPVESFPGPPFNPLRTVLEVLQGLEQRSMDASISLDEMACIVQLAHGSDEAATAVEEVRQYREAISAAPNRHRAVTQYLDSVASSLESQRAATLQDYADLNFRYLKLTGVFTEDGHRLHIAKHKRLIVDQILAEPFTPLPPGQYLERFWAGAVLPSDQEGRAIEAIQAAIQLLGDEGQIPDLPTDWRHWGSIDLSRLRLRLEDDWLKLLEERYARRQSSEWRDIVSYLRALVRPRRHQMVPPGEAPAYLEWALWRALLAVDSLANKPWEARRFRVDQEMLPIAPAPGNGPDMVFEFEDFVLVLEATLTTSSRQEAAEGEPVRRHVAEAVERYGSRGKRVYGLFIANHIDTNTAETFRIGVWYKEDDSRLALRIVPITLTQFTDLFETANNAGSPLDQQAVENLLLWCLVHSNADAPEWKRQIEAEVARAAGKSLGGQ